MQLEPHQDNPQLLDPYLNDFVPRLRDAFIAFLRAKPRKNATLDTNLLIPLSRAICRLLYTFCKIRGEKVIVQFLSTDTAHIELLLSALESESSNAGLDTSTSAVVGVNQDVWGWEEQYVILLWLSLLILNPFDLDSISTDGISSAQNLPYGLTLHADVSGIPLRIIPLAIRYLVSPGKASDGAKSLLVRVAMRKDMQSNGVSRALILWAISSLQASSDDSQEEKSDHYYLGILSFLSGILRASEDTTDMDCYLWDIYEIFQGPSATKLLATSIARKMSIKVQRSICSLVLRNPDIRDSDSILNGVIGSFLDALGDPSTPVRLAASKALSVLASKMPPSMAAEIIEEVLAMLKKNVVANFPLQPSTGLQAARHELSNVNASEWHGLILALSHLMYRRSPPPSMLSSIISALLLGLCFEKRSPTGISIGSNVRDAACFGIWALARRYTTEELQSVAIDSPNVAFNQAQFSTVQSIATELVISASLDPERNIRRGCSAALQELIGRHQDIIAEGITLVQTVEYHAVPLRSNAMLRVALRAAKLSKSYWFGISHGLLTWRGVGDPDAPTRRLSAASFGNIFWSTQDESDNPWARLPGVIKDLKLRLQKLKAREVDERHGLLLCMASVIDRMKYHRMGENALPETVSEIASVVVSVLQDAEASTYRRPELIAEACSQLINAWCHILRSEANQLPETDAIGEISSPLASSSIPASSFAIPVSFTTHHNPEILRLAKLLVSNWLRRDEPEVIEATSDAAVSLLLLLSKDEVEDMISDLINVAAESNRGQDKGVLTVLLVAYPIADSLQSSIVDVVQGYWKRGTDIESRVVVLQSLMKSVFASRLNFTDIISDGLDDYTTNARGDVGSLVRIEAVRVAGAFWKDRVEAWSNSDNANFSALFGKVLRLGSEKLDRVRIEAQRSMGYLIRPSHPRLVKSSLQLRSNAHFTSVKPIQELSASSKEYFSFLLNMRTCGSLAIGNYHDQWFLDILEGYVTSADTGSEDLIRTSRAALFEYCEIGSENIQQVCQTLLQVAKRNLKNDRVLVPTLETIAFLFDTQIMQRSSTGYSFI